MILAQWAAERGKHSATLTLHENNVSWRLTVTGKIVATQARPAHFFLNPKAVIEWGERLTRAAFERPLRLI